MRRNNALRRTKSLETRLKQGFQGCQSETVKLRENSNEDINKQECDRMTQPPVQNLYPTPARKISLSRS